MTIENIVNTIPSISPKMVSGSALKLQIKQPDINKPNSRIKITPMLDLSLSLNVDCMRSFVLLLVILNLAL